MMTVKHIEDGGKETVVSVESLVFNPDENALIGTCGIGSIRWTSGHAYVMNENGKTVAVYNITMKLK